MCLLALPPLSDGCQLETDEHYEFMTDVLRLYKETCDNVACLIGDNVNTNKYLSRNAEIAFIDC